MKRILNKKNCDPKPKVCRPELVQKRVIPVPAMTEYEEALSKGFIGTFEDYQNYKASLALGAVQPQLDGIYIRLDDLEAGLVGKASQSDLDALTGRVTVNETSISQNATEIALRAKQSDLDAVSGRLTLAESSIVQNANQIALKVNQTEFDALGVRVSAAESSIVQNADQIALRVKQEDFDALGVRVGLAESSIVQNANQIQLKVNQTDFDALGVRVSSAESSITQNANQIALKVSQSDFDALGNRVTAAESSITQNADQIALRVKQDDFDALGNRVTAAESSITQNANQIALKVSQTDFDALGVRVSSAESAITQNANQIALKVSQTDFDALGNQVSQQSTLIQQNSDQILLRATTSSVDALGNRVTLAESSITQNADQIALKVSQADIESNFSMTPNKIKLFSQEIDMTGKITFSSLDSATQNDITIIDGSRIVTGSITADKLNVNTLTAKVIQTAESGERFTVGFLPTDTSDPTSDATKFSRHGSRHYHESGKIAMYDGVVKNFQYESGGTTKTVNEYARIVFKDQANSPVLYVLDSSSTGGIQYVTATPDSYSPNDMKFITAGSLTDSIISTALGVTNGMCGYFDTNINTNEVSAELNVRRTARYYWFTAGSASSEVNRLVMNENSGSASNAIPDGWYFYNSSFLANTIENANTVAQRHRFTFGRYVDGLWQEGSLRQVITKIENGGGWTVESDGAGSIYATGQANSCPVPIDTAVNILGY